MKRLIKVISLFVALAFLSACSSKYEPPKDETLKSRLQKKSLPSYSKYKLETRSFESDSLRLNNPEMRFVYFPKVGKSSVTAPRKVRFSMYSTVIYRKGF